MAMKDLGKRDSYSCTSHLSTLRRKVEAVFSNEEKKTKLEVFSRTLVGLFFLFFLAPRGFFLPLVEVEPTLLAPQWGTYSSTQLPDPVSALSFKLMSFSFFLFPTVIFFFSYQLAKSLRSGKMGEAFSPSPTGLSTLLSGTLLSGSNPWTMGLPFSIVASLTFWAKHARRLSSRKII